MFFSFFFISVIFTLVRKYSFLFRLYIYIYFSVYSIFFEFFYLIDEKLYKKNLRLFNIKNINFNKRDREREH